jgi:multidrug efflux system membrane fusion protein
VLSRDGATKLATGKLAVLDNQVNQTTATLRLKALVPNPDRVLWPNAFVKARMLVETRKGAIVIPTVAIQRGPQGTYVYAVGQDKLAQMVPVTIALTTGEVAVVAKGLQGGEQVIIEGQNQVRPGGRVEPSNANGAPVGGPPEAAGSGAPDSGQRHRGKPAAPAAEAAPAAGPAAAGSAAGAQGATRPTAGQSRPRGPATGPTASTQAPAAP